MLNTTTESSPDAAPPAPSKARRLRVMLGALLVIAAVMALVWALTPEPPRVERLEVPKGWPNPQGSFKNSVVRRMPMWVWRARDWVRGPKRGVMIEAQFVLLKSWSTVEVKRLGLGAPALAEANGVRVWLVSSNQVKMTRWALSEFRGANSLSSSRMQTAEGMSATIMAGERGGKGSNSFSTEAVCSIESRVRGQWLDLKAILSCESHKTAAAAPIAHPAPLSLRVQIRDGQGVLVVQEKRAGIGGRPLAVWIQAAPMPKK